MSGLVERLKAGEAPSRQLDDEIATALGWSRRIVTSIGLHGRTPGRMMWCPPYPNNGYGTHKARPPRFSGPRMRASSIAALTKDRLHD